MVNWRFLTGAAGVDSLWPWAIPTLVGSPLIAWTIRAVRTGKRPKARRGPGYQPVI